VFLKIKYIISYEKNYLPAICCFAFCRGETFLILENRNLSGNYERGINVTDLNEGIYFLILKTKAGAQIKRIIKN
jgi:hypothetical protein